jgi:hypothetical protein
LDKEARTNQLDLTIPVMSYHFPSVQFNCHRGRKIVFPSSVFGRPGSGDFALTADRPSSSSATTPLLTPPPPEVHDSCLVMQQIYETDHSVCPTTYPTVSKDLEPKAEHAPLQTTPVLPFPVIDYFGTSIGPLQHQSKSLLQLIILPLTQPISLGTSCTGRSTRPFLQRSAWPSIPLLHHRKHLLYNPNQRFAIIYNV